MDYPLTQPNVNLLGGKFTDGDPTVPTPPSRDPASWANDVTDSIRAVQTDGGLAAAEGDATQLAKALRRRYGGNVTTIAATGALTDDMAGLVLIDATAGDVVLTLPAANHGPWPFHFTRLDATAHAVTIDAAGGDNIAGQASVGLAGQNSTNSMRSDGANGWHLTSDVIASSLGASGYRKYSDGFIEQWGVGTTPTGAMGTNATVSVTLPISFPTGALGAMTWLIDGGVTAISWWAITFVSALSTSSIGLTGVQNAYTPIRGYQIGYRVWGN